MTAFGAPFEAPTPLQKAADWLAETAAADQLAGLLIVGLAVWAVVGIGWFIAQTIRHGL